MTISVFSSLFVFVSMALSYLVPTEAWISSSQGWDVGRRYHLFSGAATTTTALSATVPTVEQLQSDPFIKQVSHAELLVSLLQQQQRQVGIESSVGGSYDVTELLRAQLSHADGIRGFFVTYLTAEGTATPADQIALPPPLWRALQAADRQDLIPLVCMNVVMPTGMITLHADPELAQQSQRTAERGLRVMAALLAQASSNNDDNDDNHASSSSSWASMVDHHQAILTVATGGRTTIGEEDGEKVRYWTDFFQKWGYGEVQQRDIAQAMRSVQKMAQKQQQQQHSSFP